MEFVTAYWPPRSSGAGSTSVHAFVSDQPSLDWSTEGPELVGQETSTAFVTCLIPSLARHGRRTKTLKVGPVGGGVNNGPLGAATVNPVVGSNSGLPSNTPLNSGGAERFWTLNT